MWKLLNFLVLLKLSCAFLTNETGHRYYLSTDYSAKCKVNSSEDITWDKFMTKAYLTTNKFEKFLSPHLKRTIMFSNISESCSKSLYLYLDGVKNWEPWAVYMADAMGRIPSGLLSGTKMSFGSFDQCMLIKANLSKGKESFKGKYCMVGLESPMLAPLKTITSKGKTYKEAFGYPPKWASDVFETQRGYMRSTGLWVGICIPSTCADEDVVKFFTTLTKPWTNVTVTDCQTADDTQWTKPQEISVYILLFLIGIILLGTILDPQNEEISEKYNILLKILLCFSLKKNAKELFEIKEKDRTPFDFLCGIRFFLSVLVLIIHVVILLDRWRKRRYTETFYIHRYDKVWFAHFVNAPIFMENFFVMSGLFLGLILAKQFAKCGKIHVKDFFIQRYFKILPLLLFTILMIHCLSITSSGPIWKSTWGIEMQRCQQSWWRDVLFIQNFQHHDEICLVHSWFLGCFMQTQVVGLIIMLLAIRSPKSAVLSSVLLTAFCIHRDYTTFVSHEFPIINQSAQDVELLTEFVSHIYFKPFGHIPSLLIGLGLAPVILFHSHKQFSKKFYTLGWILAVVVSQSLIFAIYLPISDMRIVAFYYATRNIFWSITFAWTIFACFNGYGGLLTTFMSLDIFIILNRISFCFYLLQPLLQYFRVASYRNRVDVQTFSFVYECSANIAITILTSIVIHIAVELPFSKLYHLLFRSKQESPPQSQSSGIVNMNKIHPSTKEKLKFS